MQQIFLDQLSFSFTSLTLFDITLNVLIAFILGFVISSVYRLTYRGYAYSVTFINTLVIICMVTTIVIMVIGNNLARAFGLVGAMSIIRFRTAVKDTRDIAFVFFSLSVGMAAGAANHMIAVVGTAFISMIIILLTYFRYGEIHHHDLLLRFWMLSSDDERPVYMDVFEKYLLDYKLLNIRSARLGEYLELSFNIRFKQENEHQEFIRQMSALEGLEKVSLIMGEETTEM
ncbi:DUF4956 domain-containing protein [candidate division KSB1 bacterium]|nr:DUF4956 domain-containing protein [candidate division KSB1 bacterium]